MKQVLVVDDSAVIRKVASRILEDLGFEIAEAADGHLALESCLANMPDVIMLDWNMPVMNGLEFLLELRDAPGGDKPKVVFCTTENDVDHFTKAIQAGANEYIMKPFDKEILEGKLAAVGAI